MINIIDMQISFIMNTLAKLQDGKIVAKWKNIPTYLFNQLGDGLICLKASVRAKNFKGLEHIHSEYWKNALSVWLDNKHLIPLEDKEQGWEGELLWNNSNVKFKGKELFFKSWSDSKLLWIKDIWLENDIIPFEDVVKMMGKHPARLFEYNAIRTAVHAYFSREARGIASDVDIVNYTEKNYKITPKFFRNLLTKEKACTPCAVHFWQKKLNYEIEEKHWTIAEKCTKEERLRLLQWKILHNIYPTNILLNKMKLRDSKKCSYCEEIDYMEHFFYGCKNLKNFWEGVKQQISVITGREIALSETCVLFGFEPDQYDQVSKTINHIILVAKLSISKYKYGEKIHLNFVFEKELAIRKITSHNLWRENN